MTDKEVTFLMVETENGFQFQIITNRQEGADSFGELSKIKGADHARATLVKLDFEEGAVISSAISKMLPTKRVPPKKEGIKLGENEVRRK